MKMIQKPRKKTNAKNKKNTVINYQKLGGLEEHKFIFSQFWKPEI